MKYTDYPGEKTFVVFHTEGTGEQGGSPVNEKEMLKSFDTMDEALAYGRDRYPRVTGWEWDNYVIDINTLTETGQEELKEFHRQIALLEKDQQENPHLYSTYKLEDGQTITVRHNPLLDKPNLKLPNE